jgi:hypothetical protein
VAHTCNPSYSGGRDQEDRGSKPAWANSLRNPFLEKPITKIGLVEWLKVKALSSNPSTTRHWWLTSIILPTWETEIGSTEVPDQIRQVVHETLSPK